MPASPALPASEPTIGRGIASMLLAVMVFSTMDALIKWLAPRYPVMEIVFFRSVFGLVPLLPSLLREGSAPFRTRRPLGQAGRALIGLGATVCFFYAYRFLPLADVFGIAFAAPLFVTALSVPLLGERVGIRRWSAVIVGFLGVLIMVRPDAGVADAASLITLLGTLCYAISLVFLRNLGKTETTVSIVFYVTCTTTLASALTMPFVWITPSAIDLPLLMLVGIMGGVGQLAITRAFRLAPAAVIAPFDYTALPYAAALGYFIWGDVPEPIFLLGAVIVIGSGLYILHRETRLARMPPPAVSVASEG